MNEQMLTATNWMNLDLHKTVDEWEFTLKSIREINDVMNRKDFEEKDAQSIFHYLTEEVNKVSFSDYLRRYIFQKAELEEEYLGVDDKIYVEIIKDAFEETGTPFAYKEIQRRKSAVVKEWLSHKNIRRDTMLLLGFGLRMSTEDVNIFLTKVLREEALNLHDAWEAICYYCYTAGESYALARELMNFYERLPENDTQSVVLSEEDRNLFQNIDQNPQIYLFQRQRIEDYLRLLKNTGIWKETQDKTYDIFLQLYQKLQDILVREFRKNISTGDMEHVIYSGIPLTKDGNMCNMSESALGECFGHRRLSRQRLDSLLKRKYSVTRYDLLTLIFHIYARTVEPDWPAERYIRFVNDASNILKSCGMLGIYPVNPYEAFLLLCQSADDPVMVFSDVWEISYGKK